MRGIPTRTEAADELRQQAASCRKLALGATTASGSEALRTAAHQFEEDASRVDPINADPAGDAASDGDAAALVRAREALERQSAQWLRPRSLPSVE
jgi:hypothetical protein